MTTTTPFSGPATTTGTGKPSSVVIIEDTYARYSQMVCARRDSGHLVPRRSSAGLPSRIIAAGVNSYAHFANPGESLRAATHLRCAVDAVADRGAARAPHPRRGG